MKVLLEGWGRWEKLYLCERTWIDRRAMRVSTKFRANKSVSEAGERKKKPQRKYKQIIFQQTEKRTKISRRGKHGRLGLCERKALIQSDSTALSAGYSGDRGAQVAAGL